MVTEALILSRTTGVADEILAAAKMKYSPALDAILVERRVQDSHYCSELVPEDISVWMLDVKLAHVVNLVENHVGQGQKLEDEVQVKIVNRLLPIWMDVMAFVDWKKLEGVMKWERPAASVSSLHYYLVLGEEPCLRLYEISSL